MSSTLHGAHAASTADIRCRRGHYGRALEDSISANQNQWPAVWQGKNPLHGGKNFKNMTAEERVSVLASQRCKNTDAVSIAESPTRADPLVPQPIRGCASTHQRVMEAVEA